ncbi:E3 ubiquitin-protein ligase arih2 [Pichia californica]|uniref:E3 ubiquitin-protein ligase arih2 n=1 Tax=Pichia californica TaxID=460514 RepID=A0A9P7BEY9_9ASCO|nr:E3 ubiquitin-protein ligase arih2 [[Candida] californica]
MEKNLECPICLDKISSFDKSYTITNPCNHFYHYDCILSWTKLSASTCPQCRTELKSINILNESKTLLIKHKEADKLSGMINQQSTSTNSLNLNNLNQPTILSTDGLINEIISTPNTSNQSNSLYHRMLQATTNPLFHNDYDYDDDYNYDCDDDYYENQQRRSTGSLFIRRNNTITTNSITDINTNNNSSNNNNHLSNQICCLCDKSVFITQLIICPNCSSLYHRSCCDGLNCPLCEEWIDDVKSPIIKKLNKSKKNIKKKNNIDDDSSYYVELVNEIQRRSNNPIESHSQVINSDNKNKNENQSKSKNNDNDKADDNNDTNDNDNEQAWNALSMIQQSSSTTEIIEPQIQSRMNLNNEQYERKLKRPKCTTKIKQQKPSLLTESALASLDLKNNNKISKRLKEELPKKNKLHCYHHNLPHPHNHNHSNNHSELSFTQKLIIQRLLLKPRLNKDLLTKLSFDSYTELNKNLSHKLYQYIEMNQYAISKLNAIIELAEREGFLPFINRKSVDLFNDSFKENNIVKMFVNGNWHNNEDTFNEKINEIIKIEVTKFK